MLWLPRLLLAHAIMAGVVHGTRPLVTYQAIGLGLGAAEIGFLASAYGLLAFALAIAGGRWVDRWGEQVFLIIGLIGIAGAVGMLATATSFGSLLIGMSLLGLCQIIAAVAIQSLVANGGDPRGRDGRFSSQTVAGSVGQIIGPLAGAYLVAGATGDGGTALPGTDAVSGTLLLGTALLIPAVVSAGTLWRWPPPTHERRDSRSEALKVQGSAIGRVMRTPSLGAAMLASMTLLAATDILVAYLPAYASQSGVGVEAVGLLLTVRAVATLTSRAGMVPLIRLVGRRRLLLAAMVFPAIGLCGITAVVSIPLWFGMMALIGLGAGLGGPLTLSWVAGRAPIDVRATAIGLRLSGNRLAQFALPAIAGLAAGAAGVAMAFIGVSILLATGSLVVGRSDIDGPTAETETR